jgi:ISXO2-like transposase domain
LAHKLREAMGSEVHNPDQPELSGEVAIDGAYFGGKVKHANRKADRTDRRAAEEQTGKRQVVVVAARFLAAPCRSSRSARAPRSRWCAKVSQAAQRFLLTNRAPATRCTHPIRCCGSITPATLRAMTMPARTKWKAGSAACAALRWASIIGSAAKYLYQYANE